MRKKKIEKMKTSELLDLAEGFVRIDDDDVLEKFAKVMKEINKRIPFNDINTSLQNIEARLDDIEEKLEKLEKHYHVDNKIVTEL